MFIYALLGFETQVGTQPAKQCILRGKTMRPMFSVAQIDGINLCHHQYLSSPKLIPMGSLYIMSMAYSNQKLSTYV